MTTLPGVVLVGLGAAVGAPLRYLVDRAIQSRHDSVFPWGTLAVNVTGSFILGIVAAGVQVSVVSGGVLAAVGVGFCGALTTYSTFGYETVKLLEAGSTRYAAWNVLGSVTAGLCAALAGAALAHLLLR